MSFQISAFLVVADDVVKVTATKETKMCMIKWHSTKKKIEHSKILYQMEKENKK